MTAPTAVHRRFVAGIILGLGLVVSVRADVFSWECDSFPVEAGWTFLGDFCAPESSVDQGWYIQDLDMDACPGAPEGAGEGFRREILEYVGSPTFFVEWRVHGTAPGSQIPAGAPTGVGIANSFGIAYTFFVANDLAKLNRDNLLPIVFVELEPGVPHVHRLELYGDELYVWYIDGEIVDSGVPEGAFPSDNASIVWAGRSWQVPTVNAWDYIRYGTIASPGSMDLDESGTVSLYDYRYFRECHDLSGPGVDAGPGCAWADADQDGDVDLTDFAEFQARFTGETE